MASPQRENGHLDVANEIAEALCRTKLSANESCILWTILRKTYGWQKKTDVISYSQFMRMTGINHSSVWRSLKRLIKRNLIRAYQLPGQKIEYCFQKDYELWDRPVSELIPVSEMRPVSEMIFTSLENETGTSVGNETHNNQYKTTIQKQNTSSRDSDQALSDPNSSLNKNNKGVLRVTRDRESRKGDSLKKGKRGNKVADPRVAEIFKRIKEYFQPFNKSNNVDPIPDYGVEGKNIKRLLDRGYSVDDIYNCWEQKTGKRNGYCSMRWVNDDIDKWIYDGRKLLDRDNGNGHKKDDDPTENIRQSLEKYGVAENEEHNNNAYAWGNSNN